MSVRRQIGKLARELRHAGPRPVRLRYFVVLSAERSGSTFFLDALDHHPRILADAHDFLNPVRVLAELPGRQSLPTRKPVRGFKMKVTEALEDIDKTRLRQQFQEMEERGIRIINLRRLDLIEQSLSGQRARHAGLYRTAGDPKSIRFAVDLPSFLQSINYYRQLLLAGEDALEGRDALVLNYDTDLRDAARQKESFERVYEYLGLKPHQPESKFHRMSNRTNADQVENLDEVVAAIAELRAQWDERSRAFLDCNRSLANAGTADLELFTARMRFYR